MCKAKKKRESLQKSTIVFHKNVKMFLSLRPRDHPPDESTAAETEKHELEGGSKSIDFIKFVDGK